MPNKQRKAEQGARNKATPGKSNDVTLSTPSMSKSASKDNKNSNTGSKADSEAKERVDDGPRKPDTRVLVSGTTSWTGKLPMNLLSEHCQKQRWEKPEYGMRKIGDQFLSWVTLRMVNPKTKETTGLRPFRLPSAHEHLLMQPTAAEARHYAATYALFRVASAKNIHLMLPPTIRDLWKELQAFKARDVADNKSWLYDADPFKAQKERDQEIEASRKGQGQQSRTEASTSLGVSLPINRNRSSPWKDANTVDLGMRRRAEVEAVVRKYTAWNAHHREMPSHERHATIERLIELGFRKKHVEEAVDKCMDGEETLEWLLIHVPEDDLPQWSFPDGYTAGVNLASSDLGRETSIKRLQEAGYPRDLCSAVLSEKSGDEQAAAEVLQNGLEKYSPGNESSSPALEDVWDEEIKALEATFADRFNIIANNTCEVDVTIQRAELTLRIVKSNTYPQYPPIIQLRGKLAAYIKLSIYRRLLQHCRELLLGHAMLYSIIDWVEENGHQVLDDPGRLEEISGAVAGYKDENEKNVLRCPVRKPPKFRKPTRGDNSRELRIAFEARMATHGYQHMLQLRQMLPAWALRQEIVRAIQRHQVTIVSGETGSGKSTQVVQFILEDLLQTEDGAAANIFCTQPRRISALGLAQRVSEERSSQLGDEVGYSIRGESKLSAKTKITFLTTGVLLRRLQISQSYTEALEGISHLVVDEVHERDLDTDFLLILLRDILSKQKNIKIILMSATLNADVFETYFGKHSSVARVSIPGRTFPITDHYLDEILEFSSYSDGSSRDQKETIQKMAFKINYGLIMATVKAINDKLGGQDGGILIFLPGVAEINRTVADLKGLSGVIAFPLHASLTTTEQRLVFSPVKKGYRKVIAATNVAETSITIDDIVAVIDTGKVKQTAFDPQSNMTRLQECLISKASAKQRRGRAGRTRAGDCYKLYTEDTERQMASRPDPEIMRVPLEQLYLSVRAMGIKEVLGFLQRALTPPTITAIEGARDLLLKMGALEGEDLTALGYHLSRIPADLRLAKLMIYGALFCCLDRSIIIASILTCRSPFLSSQGDRETAKLARLRFAFNQGDLFADLRAYEEWSEKRNSSTNADTKQWCFDNFLSEQTLREIAANVSQYVMSLQDIGFVEHRRGSDPAAYEALNVNRSHMILLQAIVAGAFYPQVARIQLPNKKYAETISGTVELDPEARTIRYFLRDTGRVFIHPSSTLFDVQSFHNNNLYLAYFNKMTTTKSFIRDITPFNTYALLLFGGKIILDSKERGLVVDKWIRIRGWARIGVLVSRLRSILDGILEAKIDSPGALTNSEQAKEVLKVVMGLLEYNGLDR